MVYKKYLIKIYLSLLTVILLASSYFILPFNLFSRQVAADEAMVDDETGETNRYFSIQLDEPTIARGYTVSAFNSALKLSLVPGILSGPTAVEVIELHEEMPWPWSLDRLSAVYQFEFKNKAAYDHSRPFYIQLSYEIPSNYYKQVFFYDKNYRTWRPLPTRDFPRKKFVRSLIHLPFARIAVFAYPDILAQGRASWYRHKGGLFAASPDFPRGSRLRVWLADGSRFVDVDINDYGPDRSQHPNRVLDLDSVAFSQLAKLSQGMVNIRIEPLYIAPIDGRRLNVPATGVGTTPKITAAAGIVMERNGGRVLWQKNSTTTRPLASLTKMVAVKVFLDTRPSLNRVVAYSKKDEEYNYKYCHKWESARLRLSEGETLTVENLIYSSLVGSTNNTVETLVRVSGLSRDQFIAKMNQIVRSWGATTTHFVEPTGLAPENVSSAADYAIITMEVLKNPIIAKVSHTPIYEFYTINKHIKHRLKNTNYLIRLGKYNIISSKTGYLNEAGYCLMTTVGADNGREIIVVTLGASTRDLSFIETENLIKYGLRGVDLE
jgi:D-alanyl-D-alanine endopeptidase (penicillin-binding protein 7)